MNGPAALFVRTLRKERDGHGMADFYFVCEVTLKADDLCYVVPSYPLQIPAVARDPRNVQGGDGKRLTREKAFAIAAKMNSDYLATGGVGERGALKNWAVVVRAVAIESTDLDWCDTRRSSQEGNSYVLKETIERRLEIVQPTKKDFVEAMNKHVRSFRRRKVRA